MKHYYITYACGGTIAAQFMKVDCAISKAEHIAGIAGIIRSKLANTPMTPIPLPEVVLLNWVEIDAPSPIIVANGLPQIGHRK